LLFYEPIASHHHNKKNHPWEGVEKQTFLIGHWEKDVQPLGKNVQQYLQLIQ
jgi:hypothetical protein